MIVNIFKPKMFLNILKYDWEKKRLQGDLLFEKNTVFVATEIYEMRVIFLPNTFEE